MLNPRRAFGVIDFLLTLLLAAAVGFLVLIVLSGTVRLLYGGSDALKRWLIHIQIEGSNIELRQWGSLNWTWWKAARPQLALTGVVTGIWLARFAVRRAMRFRRSG